MFAAKKVPDPVPQAQKAQFYLVKDTRMDAATSASSSPLALLQEMAYLLVEVIGERDAISIH